MHRHVTYQRLARDLRQPTIDGWVRPLPSNHNGGPPLDKPHPWGDGPFRTYFEWRAATEEAFRKLPTGIALRRARKAEALGLTYYEYQLEILERGRHLQKSDKDRIAQIIARRDVRY